MRRSTRECRPLTRYPFSEYIFLTDEGELEYFQEVESHKDKESWIKAMQEEMNSLHKNKTYELVVTKEKLELCAGTTDMNSN